MNDLDKILETYEDLGLELGFTSTCGNDTGVIEMIQLIDNRGPDWEVVFEITDEHCNVIEFNYNCECQEQSNETLPTFEEALELAAGWC